MSYDQLIAITKEMRQTARDEREKDPVACPFDGTPLELHPGKNILHCPNGDFQTRVGAGRPLGL